MGKETGTVVTGYLFTIIGTTFTLYIYAAVGLALFVILVTYLLVAEVPEGHGDAYKRGVDKTRNRTRTGGRGLGLADADWRTRTGGRGLADAD